MRGRTQAQVDIQAQMETARSKCFQAFIQLFECEDCIFDLNQGQLSICKLHVPVFLEAGYKVLDWKRARRERVKV